MRRRIAAALMMVAFADPARARATQPRSDDQIIVTGDKRSEIRKEAYQFVKTLGAPAGDRQTARWVQPVCPKAMGVSAETGALIEREVREIATQVGAPVAKANCVANLAIVLSTTADGPRILRSYSMLPKEFKAAGDKITPIRWWYNSQLKGSDGQLVMTMPPPSMPANVSFGMFGAPYLTLYETGRNEAPTMRVIERAFVLIDVDQVERKSLRSLIDYATLVGLSEIRLGAAPQNSILSLFEPEHETTELTSNDVSFLKTLYSMPLARTARQQRGTLATGISKGRGESEFRR